MSRVPAKINSKLEKSLLAYMAASAAAGVGVLALAQPSSAEVIYTKAHMQIQTPYPVDLNHDGITDITFRFEATSRYGIALFYATTPNSAGFGYRPLPKGDQINSHHTFFQSANLAVCTFGSCQTSKGNGWFHVHRGYLGVEFSINGQTHYGWIRLDIERRYLQYIDGYAYESVPNRPILAGETKGKSDETVSNPTLGHLALGAPGLAAWR
jgi:hypothetical protein